LKHERMATVALDCFPDQLIRSRQSLEALRTGRCEHGRALRLSAWAASWPFNLSRPAPIAGICLVATESCICAATSSSYVSTTENLIPAAVKTHGIWAITAVASSCVGRTSARDRCAIERQSPAPGGVSQVTMPEVVTAFTRYGMGSGLLAELRMVVLRDRKKTDVAEHSKVLDHVGLLTNGFPSAAGSPFI
jgi:hypothetical protein